MFRVFVLKILRTVGDEKGVNSIREGMHDCMINNYDVTSSYITMYRIVSQLSVG